ncbi:hypothetical protein N0V83_002489 [Neocucurbitaria cava]|uniref:Uncharacterized protein n=1 Tax=Neocucurbitaria cava TaxID=798079 RepID=A0A9W8YEI2_9PLEO|nr:hypothetical protein N0V83_002489 [Neocucurbitaria cava]
MHCLAAAAQHHETKELVLRQRENETREEGALVLKKTNSALSDLTQSREDEDEEVDVESWRDLRKDVKEARANMQEYKEVLVTVLISFEARRTGLKIKNMKIQGNGKALVSIQNMDGTEGELNVSIEDVLVDGNAMALVGIQKGVDIYAFFSK